MARTRIQRIARNFQENGMKLLLEDPRNVRELFGITRLELVKKIDFERLELVKTSFVHRDYRNVEADVVLTAPLRLEGKGRSRRKLILYILIEHQSEPDRLMPLRLLDYVVQIFRFQQRPWLKSPASLDRLGFDPVLPVVLYTGTRRWASPGQLVELIEAGELVARFTPAMESLFLSLPAVPPEQLETGAGYFGWVLRLVQERKSRPAQFRDLLRRAVAELEAMPAEERLRWLELLSYIYALVYHVREASERPVLREAIEASVGTDQHRKELFEMGKTIAEELRQEGRQEGRSEGILQGRREALIRLLNRRFGELPQAMIRTIENTPDVATLDQWLDSVVTADQLSDIGITPAE